MRRHILKNKASMTERLLVLREKIGDDQVKCVRYHELINRLHRIITMHYNQVKNA